MKKTWILLLLISNLLSASCEKENNVVDNDFKNEFTISSGEDWSFPTWVKPKYESGLGYMGEFSSNPKIKHAGTTLTWAMLNPSEGVYDFSELEKWLKKAEEADGMILFRLKASVLDRKSPWEGTDGSFIPPWVVEKHQPKTFYTRKEDNGNYLLYAAPWDSGVQNEFKKFVEEFGKREYFANKHFLAIYLHAMSRSYGEEFFISEEFTPQLLEAGLEADLLMKCFKDRMDWWSEAAGKYSHKLAWVGAGSIQGFDYPKEELDRYADQNGFGRRGGFIENYFYEPVVPPVAGQKYVNGYVINDWGHFFHDGRIFGDESEETDEFGVASDEEIRFMQQSIFYQAARVGINFLWVSEKNISLAPKVADWYCMVAGKGPTESPDASCWLREAYVRSIYGDKKIRTWKNFERLLMQRDMEGAKTLPVEKYNLNGDNNKGKKDPSRMYEYSARRTDTANGQTKMIFILNDEFEQSLKGNSQIKITYLDNTSSEWNLLVSTKNGTSKFGTIKGKNDGKWKTITFSVEDKINKGSLGNGASFIIDVKNRKDLTVKHARVIRMV
ncbi:hypothetical protein [uncultured Draconibacterium sp.]|uniref:hypothetical protein n=1 Tax=uncultured Draconibacterium sp. TaxID=1573823 RepID=UPI0029C6324F|nr:hypothetical protein [uncultured Draconibacterium sp.]